MDIAQMEVTLHYLQQAQETSGTTSQCSNKQMTAYYMPVLGAKLGHAWRQLFTALLWTCHRHGHDNLHNRVVGSTLLVASSWMAAIISAPQMGQQAQLPMGQPASNCWTVLGTLNACTPALTIRGVVSLPVRTSDLCTGRDPAGGGAADSQRFVQPLAWLAMSPCGLPST